MAELNDMETVRRDDDRLGCENCDFFQSKPSSPVMGWCRRFPPQVISNGDSSFPLLSRHDYCGEWRSTEPIYENHSMQIFSDASDEDE
jgi:hypothetical protein